MEQINIEVIFLANYSGFFFFSKKPVDLLNITLILSFRFGENTHTYSSIHIYVKVLSFPLGNIFNIIQRRRQWQPTPVLLPGKSHRQRSLVGWSPWGRQESDTTEGLHFHFSLSCIGEGNGNPLQCSCLENPRDGGTWWAAISGIAQTRTRLKRLSSSSSKNYE